MKKDYFALWSILAVAFVIMLLLSTCKDGVDLMGVNLKASTMADALLAKNEYISEADTLSELSAEEPMSIFPVPVDTAQQTILFIGDSMLEGLYPRLAAYCDASGHTLYAVIWYSSTSEIWGRAHLLTEYINRCDPTYIVICLGSNELFVKDIIQKRDGYVKSIIAECGDIPFLWIGPPNWKPDTGINQLIETNAPLGCYFKSDGMTFERKKDGAHPTPASAIVWTDSIVRWMPEHSLHPIVLNAPDKQTSRAKKVYVHQPGEDPYPNKKQTSDRSTW